MAEIPFKRRTVQKKLQDLERQSDQLALAEEFASDLEDLMFALNCGDRKTANKMRFGLIVNECADTKGTET